MAEKRECTFNAHGVDVVVALVVLLLLLFDLLSYEPLTKSILQFKGKIFKNINGNRPIVEELLVYFLNALLKFLFRFIHVKKLSIICWYSGSNPTVCFTDLGKLNLLMVVRF
jgi:hypothetical protein